jgi:protein TonB
MSPADSPAPGQDGAPAAEPARRCESCGRPTQSGDLCPSCEEAFEWAFNAASVPQPQVESLAQAKVSGASQPADASKDVFAVPQTWNEMLAVTDRVPDHAEPAATEVPRDAQIEAPGEVPVPPQAAPELGAHPIEESRLPDPAPRPPDPASKPSDPAATPLDPAAYFVPIDPASLQKPRIGRFEIMAVALIAAFSVAGVLVGAFWPHPQALSARGNPSGQQPVTADARHAPAPDRGKAKAAEVVHAAPPSAETAPKTNASARKPRPTRAVARVERKARVTPQSVAPEAEGPVVAPPVVAPVAAVVAPARPTIAIETPSGRFFEAREVDQAPRIATRIEPQLPPGLAGRHESDVVVVRLLVSQSGHPFRLNLLRRSRMGAPADEAVIAAVKQWTFSPARKYGEAVACWLNVGVPLTGNN